MDATSSNLSCGYNGDDPDDMQYLALGVLHTCSAAVSFFSSLLVIFLIILFKKYTFFVQRLILYLSLAALLYSIAAVLARTTYRTLDDFPPHFCEAMGFLTQYTQWTLLLSVSVITLDILLRVILNRPTNILEPFYIAFIILFPATFNWIPFLNRLYGPSGSWCWIRTQSMSNTTTCVKDNTGVILQFTLWYGPLFLVLILIVLSYIAILSILRRYKQRMNIYNHEEMQLLKTMRKEVFILMWYPFVFMLINVFPLTNRIIHACVHQPIYSLWVLHAIISPLQGGFIAIVYAFDPETRRKLTFRGMMGALDQHCPCLSDRGNIEEYHTEVVTENGNSVRKPLLSNKK